MDTLTQFFGALLALALLGAAFAFIFNNRQLIDSIKKFALYFLFGLVGLAVLQKLLAAMVRSGDYSLLLLFASVSIVAYFIRARRKRLTDPRQQLRGNERTPLMPRHFHRENDR